MKVNIYAMYDSLAKQYSDPFLSVNDDTAVRTFKRTLRVHESIPAEFKLFRIGEFDTDKGRINGLASLFSVYVVDIEKAPDAKKN